jgi:Flp pilus assembly protein TadD
MTKSQRIGARLGLIMVGAAMVFGAAPVGAQTGNPSLDSPGQALSRNLRSLAENPKSLGALLGAGKAALELGDPQAAITFFGRAEEQAPRDGRIKMWLGASLVQLGQAQGALKFFAEAVSLGAPETEVAGARGLAYDLLGDTRRAQRDYRMALQARPNAEVSRHLALSLAISGEREPALLAIDDQLLIRDRAAERTKAFVLALTGDAAGAARAVQASMPAQSAALSPFLERLPALSPSERALAVHLGHFPSHARNIPAPRPNAYASATPSSTTRAGAPDPRQSALGSRTAAAPKTVAPARTPQRQVAAATPQRSPAPAAAAPKPRTETAERTQPSRIDSSSPWAWSRGSLQTRRSEPAPRTAAPKPAGQQASVQAPRTGTVPASPVQQSAAAVTPAPQAQAQPQPLAAVTVASAAPQPQVQSPLAIASVAQQQPSFVATPAAQVPVQTAAAAPAPVVQPPVQTALAAPVPQALKQMADAASAVSQAAAMPGFALTAAAQPSGQQQPVSELASVEAPPPAPAPVEERGASRLAGIASLIATLPETAPEMPAAEPVAKPTPAPVKPTVAAATKELPAPAKPAAVVAKKEAPAKAVAKKEVPPAAAKKEVAAKKPAAPAEPKRIWVQVAGGADKAALPREFTRLKSKAPKVMAGQTAWTTPLKATNRLLVGPFKSDGDAQAFVNELKKADLSGFAWTSEAGQKIEKLAAK